MSLPSNFEIIKPSSKPRISLKYGSAAPRGRALGAHATDPETAILAAGDNFLGFTTRQIITTSPGLREAVLGVGNSDTGLENAVKTGEYSAIEDPEMVEIEGTDYIKTTGAGEEIDANSVVGTKVSWVAGLCQEAQSGEKGTHIIIANSAVASSAFASVNGGIRLRLKRI